MQKCEVEPEGKKCKASCHTFIIKYKWHVNDSEHVGYLGNKQNLIFSDGLVKKSDKCYIEPICVKQAF